MAPKKGQESSIPATTQPVYDAIIAMTDFFCRVHLSFEYEELCRKLADTLAQKDPSPLLKGRDEVWACAIVRVIGWVNFLDDSGRTSHLKLTAIDKAFGAAESTGQGKAKAIRDLLKIHQFDFHWMLREQVEKTPMAWMIEMNGFLVDARLLKREFQEVAFQKGLIPYIPGVKPIVVKGTDDKKGSYA